MTAVTEVPARGGAVAAWVGIGTGIVVLAGVLAAIASISQLPAQGLLDPEAADIEAIVQHTKGKPIEQLTKMEASAVIDWLGKTTKDDLQDLIIDLAMDGAGK